MASDGEASELWRFLRSNKAWWLPPVVVVLLLLVGLVVLGLHDSAPALYNVK